MHPLPEDTESSPCVLHPSDLCFRHCHYIFFSDLPASPFPLLRMLMMSLGPRDNPGPSPYLRVLNSCHIPFAM